jgi:hypothetical protein
MVVVSGQQEQEQDEPHPLSQDEIALLESRDCLKEGNIERAYAILSSSFIKSSRNVDPQQRLRRLSQRKISLGGGLTFTSEYKLKADLEQAEYLAGILSQSDPSKADFFQNIVIPTYKKILYRMPSLEELSQTMGLYQFQPADVQDGIMNIYNRILHWVDVDDTGEDGTLIPILSDTINAQQIQTDWVDHGIVIVDNLLSKESLQRIQETILWESTIWFQTKLPERFGGYTGAYIDDGLHQHILLKLSAELPKLLPEIFQYHPLKYMWAYKYDSDYGGINLHADEAAVNVNIWLTPEDANLDPKSGGLVIYTIKPPHDWDFESYNRDTDFVYETLIKPSGYANVTIPYKENRAVIFDSALFHTTDHFKFKQGYKNRRINLTLLYGDMQKQQRQQEGSSHEL